MSSRKILKLLQRLVHKNGKVRIKAAKSLQKLGEEDWTYRIDGEKFDYHEFGKSNDIRLSKPLMRVYPKVSVDEKRMIMHSLGHLGNSDAFDFIVSHLSHTERRIRNSAVIALGQLGDNRAIPILHKKLQELNILANAYIKDVLKSRQQPEDKSLLLYNELKDYHALIIYALTNLNAVECVEDILESLNFGFNNEITIEAARAMVKFKYEPAVELLTIHLGSVYTDVIETVVEVLGDLGCGEAVKSLCNILTFPESTIRYKAVNAISKINDKHTIPYILAQLKRDNYLAMVSSIEILGNMKAVSVLDEIIRFSKSTHPGVRGKVAWALGNIGEKRAFSTLKELVYDQDENVVFEAIEALRNIEGPNKYELLKPFLNHECQGIRNAAERIINQIKE